MKIELTEDMLTELRIINDLRARLPKRSAIGLGPTTKRAMGVHGVNIAILVTEAISAAVEGAGKEEPCAE